MQLTLTHWQQRALQRTVVWFLVAAGILLGWLAALFVAASSSGNGVFGVSGSSIYLVLIANGLVLVCMVIGAAVAWADLSTTRRIIVGMLDAPPLVGPLASAVLVRVVRARRETEVHQLIYAAHPEGETVRPVIVPVPNWAHLPEPGVGAWLTISQQMPAFAGYFNTTPEQHAAALNDPAFEKLSKVQRGLAVPGSTFLLPLLIGVVALLVSLISFSSVLGTFG